MQKTVYTISYFDVEKEAKNMEFLLLRRPKNCFVLLGINDFSRCKPFEDTPYGYVSAIEWLQELKKQEQNVHDLLQNADNAKEIPFDGGFQLHHLEALAKSQQYSILLAEDLGCFVLLDGMRKEVKDYQGFLFENNQAGYKKAAYLISSDNLQERCSRNGDFKIF